MLGQTVALSVNTVLSLLDVSLGSSAVLWVNRSCSIVCFLNKYMFPKGHNISISLLDITYPLLLHSLESQEFVFWKLCDFQSLGLDSLEGPGVMFRRLKPPPLDACN